MCHAFFGGGFKDPVLRTYEVLFEFRVKYGLYWTDNEPKSDFPGTFELKMVDINDICIYITYPFVGRGC
jgi:hypothetical protein